MEGGSGGGALEDAENDEELDKVCVTSDADDIERVDPTLTELGKVYVITCGVTVAAVTVDCDEVIALEEDPTLTLVSPFCSPPVAVADADDPDAVEGTIRIIILYFYQNYAADAFQ